MPVLFGDFAFDQERRQLLRSGKPVPLETKAYELLGLLLSRRPNALSKTQIRAVLWPGTFVSESALARLVTQLRSACGDDAQAPRFIRTVHGFGYAFCGDVREAGDEQPSATSPYPGLSPFAEADADRFYGREAEVEALWEKVRRQKLLAVIGPSGVGKTSLLRAGLIPHRPSGWAAVACTPGGHPFVALAQALAPMLAADSEAMADLFQGVSDAVQGEEADRLVSAISRWRRHHEESLLVLDQFEELFTLNVPEVQVRFARLVGRVVDESGLSVVLGVRDDFFMRCGEHAALAPVFHEVTPLLPPSPESLKRALREPAARQGVRFEDEALVEEMTAAVSAERGALPLLAFAAARLWEERDRERRLLTREAYGRLGGIAGALAQHAEATLRRLGTAGEPTVRELFRSLVTAQGTRVSRERAELLSVFRDGWAAADRVLDALIAARLLTVYDGSGQVDVGSASEMPLRRALRIEIVHESLLTQWPRLVRWQTQDADGAQLRDQLGQAARLWDEKTRPDELLWTGRAYEEYRLWRGRYSGGLTETESAFARAMDAHATRRRRRRRAAVAAVIATLTLGLAVIGALWTRAERAREAAQAETLRREADQLLALGRLRLQESPAEALAYAIASLERTDNEPARRFAVAALWRGPTPSVFATADHSALWEVSRDGRWAAMGTANGVRLWSSERGDARTLAFSSITNPVPRAAFSDDSRRVVVTHPAERLARVYAVEDAKEIQAIDIGTEARSIGFVRGDRVIDVAADEALPKGMGWLRAWSLSGKGVQRLGRWRWAPFTIDASGSRLFELRGGILALRRLDDPEGTSRPLGRHEGAFGVHLHPSGAAVYTDGADGIRLWVADGRSPSPARTIRAPRTTTLCREWGLQPQFDPGGHVLAAWLRRGADASCTLAILDLDGPPDAEPLALTTGQTMGFGFDSSGRWLLSAHGGRSYLWPVSDRRPRVLRVPGLQEGPAFTPDGRFLAAGTETEMQLWPVTDAAGDGVRILYRDQKHSFQFGAMAFDPRGRFLATAGEMQDEVFVLPIPSGRPRRFSVPGAWAQALAVSPDGRRLAASYILPQRAGSARIHVWNVEDGAEKVLDPRVSGEDCASESAWEGSVFGLAFLSDGTLLSAGNSGIRLWEVESGRNQRIRKCLPGGGPPKAFWTNVALAPATRLLASVEPSEAGSKVLVFDLDRRSSREITTHGTEVETVAFDPTGRTLVTGDRSGVVRAGPVTGEEPHLFFGHTSGVSSVVVSPDDRWIASASWTRVSSDNRVGDQTIRLWPMPEGPPLHTLPRTELLETLRSLTNLRVVPDPVAPIGYKVAPGPFRGWAKAPAW